jgi:hypothetical protein
VNQSKTALYSTTVSNIETEILLGVYQHQETGPWVPTDAQLMDFYIEIGVRDRGSNMVAVSAETNTAGDEITVTFDKDVQPYFLGDFNCFADSGIMGLTDINMGSAPNKVVLSVNVGYTSADVITLDYDSELSQQPLIESVDYGRLTNFTGLAVTNNIID